ncbi:MAG: heme ABC exporter ATP-binding protein CcmA [Myxococcaceae bacterium]
MSNALECHDVSKRYGQRWALARLSLVLPAGASLLLTGHNGSGKTTLLRLLATLFRPTTGQVLLFGQDAVAGRASLRPRIALLGHTTFLYEDLTARENCVLLTRLLGRPVGEVEGLLERTGLGQRADQPVRTFSAGMKKRLAIARLLLKQPALALLDEPFGELDPAGIAEMEEHIRGLTRAGTTVVLATHQVEHGQSLCTERLHLAAGREAAA